MRFTVTKKDGWSYFSVPRLEDGGIRHGFFTRESPPHHLEGKEKERFLRTFGLKDLVIMHQEHGTVCHLVKNGERPGRGDGIVLLEKDVAAVIKTADCLPIILCDPEIPAAAIVHAGWRGTVKGIVRVAVRTLLSLGASPSTIICLQGPSISPCCYEVKEDVERLFSDAHFPPSVFRREQGRLYLDLRKANREVLAAMGVEKIFDLARCTYCEPDSFVSYRRGETAHRQLNFVSLR